MVLRKYYSIFVRFLALFGSALLLSSCFSRENARVYHVADTVLSGLSDREWTYFCLSEGVVVGQSDFGSDSEDAVWALRGDWDFAICGDYLKTNGGTSGSFGGGLQPNTIGDFASVTKAPEDGYVSDTREIVVRD